LRSADVEVNFGMSVRPTSEDESEPVLDEPAVDELDVPEDAGVTEPRVEASLMGVVVSTTGVVAVAVLGRLPTDTLKPLPVPEEVLDGVALGTTPLVPLWPSPEQRPWHEFDPFPNEPEPVAAEVAPFPFPSAFAFPLPFPSVFTFE
jgi:hypothetical protein